MHPGASADDVWLLSRVESLLDCLTDESKIQKKKFGSKAKRELSRDFVSVIRGVRPAFMLDYAPLMTKEDIELISKELNEDVLIPLSRSRGRGGEEEGGVLLKVCSILDTVVFVKLGEDEELLSHNDMPILVDLDQENARARKMTPLEIMVMTACRAKISSNSGVNIDESDLGEGAIPPQTFVGWMLGYPILYYYGSNKKYESEEEKEQIANVTARKLSLCSLVKVECINDKDEVMYGFTYPESLIEDALLKEALKRWMDGIEKEQKEQRQQEHAIGLSVRVTHRGPSPIAL